MSSKAKQPQGKPAYARIAVSAALVSAIMAQHTLAQDRGGLEEIVVTAQKRSESLQDTPLTISAFSGDTARANAINSIVDLSVMTPGLNMTQNGGGVLPYMRGIGATSAAGGQESPVAIFVDGVYFQNGYGSDVGLYDIERVEVLKGPQGTLFGRNVTGGLIHIITRDPSNESEAQARLQAGTYRTFEGDFYGSTGLTENVAGNLSVHYRDQNEGFAKNTFLGMDQYFRDELNLRSKIKYAADRTSATLSIAYSDMESDKGQIRYLPPGSVGVGGFVHKGGFLDVQSNVADNINYVDNRAISLKLEHEFELFDALSISAYNDQDADTRLFDNDYTENPLLNAGLRNHTKYFTQELQINSSNDTGNRWIAGVYFMDSETHVILSLSSVGGRFRDGYMDTKSIAGFGEYTFAFNESTEATLGFRYTQDKRDIDGVQLGRPIAKQDDKWTDPTYRAVFKHHMNDDVMFYGSYTRGFKSGNFNVVSPASPAVDPEYIDAFEAGMKGSFLDSRLKLDVAAFFYKYKDMQLTIFQGNTTQTINAAKAEMKGVDITLTALLTDAFQVDLGVSAMDGEYTDFPNFALSTPRLDANGNPIGGNGPPRAVDVSGNPLQRTPEFQGTLGGTYTLDLNSGSVVSNIRATYTKSYPWEPDGRLEEDGYVVVNASIGWHDPGDRWEVGVVGRNIFDEKYSIGTFTTTAQNDLMVPAEPATFAVYIDHRF